MVRRHGFNNYLDLSEMMKYKSSPDADKRIVLFFCVGRARYALINNKI